jgi:hypothetical protein
VLVLEIAGVGEEAPKAGVAVAAVVSMSTGRKVASVELLQHTIRVRTMAELEDLHAWGITLESAVKRALAGVGAIGANRGLPRTADGL